MPFSTNILIAVSVVLWLLWLWSRRKYYLMYFRLPGPYGYPLLGSGLHFLDQIELFDYMGKVKEIYGRTLFGFLGIMPCFITSDPKVIEEIFTSEQFIDKMNIYSVLNDFIRDGLFTSPYEIWSRARKHINKAFAHKVLLNFMPVFNTQVRELCQVLDTKVGQEFDIHNVLETVQLDTACITTMGQKTNFLRGENPHLLEAYSKLIKWTSSRLFNPITRQNFVFKYFFKYKKEYKEYLKIVKENTQRLVENKLKQIKQEEEAHKNEKSLAPEQDSSPEDDMNITKSKTIFIDIMVREYLAGNFTWDEMKAEVDTMVLAAFETTTSVIFFSLILLSMFPQYQDKLYEEIISVVTDDDDVVITYEHIQQLVYTEMVMNETMRLLSPVPLVGRNAVCDVTLKNGIFIAKDTNVIIDIFHLHRDEETWGPGADRIFNPDNFLKSNFAKKHPYSFVPFTKGIRNCIGWRYAIMSYKVMMAHLLRRYKFSTNAKFEDLVYTEQVVIKFKENPKLYLELRKKQK